MASAVTDIIRLAEKLRECEALVSREESIHQAIGEAEARLASLRSREQALEADCSRRRVQLNEEQAGAEVQANAIRAAAANEAARLRREAEDAAKRKLVEAEERARELDGIGEAKAAAVRRLEAEESRLAQSVSHLRSELEALKARVLG